MPSRKNKSKTPMIRVARKSGDGRFTTLAYAKKHPRTTEIERYRRKSG